MNIEPRYNKKQVDLVQQSSGSAKKRHEQCSGTVVWYNVEVVVVLPRDRKKQVTVVGYSAVVIQPMHAAFQAL